MKITEEVLSAVVTEAYHLGQAGCASLKDQEVAGVLQRHGLAETPNRIYKAAELKGMAAGTVFQHPSKGRGVVRDKGDRSVHMAWDKGGHTDFVNDSAPWNRPMRLVSRP